MGSQPQIVLHHYETSPFGTAIRQALGFKKLAWKSVIAPMVAPKPELSALTGGYERIPVLQIGADVYCDTSCIVEALERHRPEPTLYPQPMGRAARMIGLWSGNEWFMPAVGVALGTDPKVVDDAFWEDRSKRFGMNPDSFLPMVPHLTAQFHAGAQIVANTLSDGRRFIAGDEPGYADFMVNMNILFVAFGGVKPDDFGPEIAAWSKRVSALGFGAHEDWTPDQAIEHAATCDPIGENNVLDGSGFSAGQQVTVTTESPDPAAVTGTLVGLDSERITLSRSSGRTGEMHVHFPRLGQVLKPL